MAWSMAQTQSRTYIVMLSVLEHLRCTLTSLKENIQLLRK